MRQILQPLKGFKEYWRIYGGLKAVLGSLYFIISIIISSLSFHIWLNPYWWEIVLNIIPNLIGFSLGGFAIFLAFSSSDFIRKIAGQTKEDMKNHKESPFIIASNTFVHFIISQSISLLIALIAMAFYYPPPKFVICILSEFTKNYNEWLIYIRNIFWFVGYTIFIYAVIVTLAATLNLFKVSKWLDLDITIIKQKEEEVKKKLEEEKKPKQPD